MAKNEKKISIAAFDKIAKAQEKPGVTKQWFDTQIHIRHTLGFAEMLAFVDDVVKSCMQEGLGYLPEVREFLVKCNVLTRYANFTLPDNLEHRYALVYGTDAVETVLDGVDRKQLEEIINAIDDKLDYLCNANAAELEKQVHKLEDTFAALAKQMEDIFSGVDGDDIGKLTSAIANGGLNEEKIVEAYMKEKYGMGPRLVGKAEAGDAEA